MNKAELSIVVLLFTLLFGWSFFQKTLYPPPARQPETVAEEEAGNGVELKDRFQKGTSQGDGTDSGDGETAEIDKIHDLDPSTDAAEVLSKQHRSEEQTFVLSNTVVKLVISSWGGSITSVNLQNYRATVDENSDSIRLDFSTRPALSLTGIPGMTTNHDFHVSLDPSGGSARLSVNPPLAPTLERVISLGKGYLLEITDTFSNPGTVPMKVPAYGMALGPMHMIKTNSMMGQIPYLGLDTMAAAGGSDVIYWTQKGPPNDKLSLAKRFEPEHRRGRLGCPMFKPRLIERLPLSISVSRTNDTDWIAVKNKFFVQLFAPEDSGSGFALNAKRHVPDIEDEDNSRTWSQAAEVNEVSADMRFREHELQPGESLTRKINYYVGPKKYSVLKQLGNDQDKIMFKTWRYCGWFRSICIALLSTLNGIYKILPDYGVAIILLTIIVKIVFWPITHKSTDSMKKMQKIQPLVNEIRKKYKDKPQKMNKEVMALYKEHKVNPMMGCLPMLVQMPVFLALFTVLRSATELRFAEFLWIHDLSEPERLFPFGFTIPMIGWDSLNILPLTMTATMVWQQKLTPTAGDPQQQKMMMIIMPIMMLFLLYNMASALMLYWTVSQCLSIAQMLIQRKSA